MERVKIFASIVDDATKKQIKELSESDAYKFCTIRVMPDCHSGKGCTIGSVIQFCTRIVPNTVGVDLGCGMYVASLGKVDIDLHRLDEIVRKEIPSGFNVYDKPVTGLFPLNLVANIKDKDYIERSLGTLGGGNHFIELDVDDDGNKYLVIHSGSRNLGVQVCNYWQNIAIKKAKKRKQLRVSSIINNLKEVGKEKEIQKVLKSSKIEEENQDLAYLDGEDGDIRFYLYDMTVCQKFASSNRKVIANRIAKAMGFQILESFETIHNYIDLYNSIIRKGAVSARKGEKIIIPMNMRDGSLICVGKGNNDWLCSAPHGAGRILSRAQAKKSINIKDYEKSMSGIYSTSVCKETIDEAPMVYKPIDVILEDIQPTVDVIKVIKPIYNFKAKDNEKRL